MEPFSLLEIKTWFMFQMSIVDPRWSWLDILYWTHQGHALTFENDLEKMCQFWKSINWLMADIEHLPALILCGNSVESVDSFEKCVMYSITALEK